MHPSNASDEVRNVNPTSPPRDNVRRHVAPLIYVHRRVTPSGQLKNNDLRNIDNSMWRR